MEKSKTDKNSIYNMSLKEGDIIFVRLRDGKTHMYVFYAGEFVVIPDPEAGSEDSIER